MFCGMMFVRLVNRGEFDWVLDEEYWLENFSIYIISIWRMELVIYNVVEDKVLVVFFSEDFYWLVFYILNSFGCVSFWFYSGDMYKNFGFFVNFIEESSWSDIWIVVSYFKFVLCINGRSMYGMFGNVFFIEVG